MKEKDTITDLTYKASSLFTTVYVLNHNKIYIKFKSEKEKHEWAKRTNSIRAKAYRYQKRIREGKY